MDNFDLRHQTWIRAMNRCRHVLCPTWDIFLVKRFCHGPWEALVRGWPDCSSGLFSELASVASPEENRGPALPRPKLICQPHKRSASVSPSHMKSMFRLARFSVPPVSVCSPRCRKCAGRLAGTMRLEQEQADVRLAARDYLVYAAFASVGLCFLLWATASFRLSHQPAGGGLVPVQLSVRSGRPRPSGAGQAGGAHF